MLNNSGVSLVSARRSLAPEDLSLLSQCPELWQGYLTFQHSFCTSRMRQRGNHTRKNWPRTEIDWFPAATIPKFLNNCLQEASLARGLGRTILGKEKLAASMSGLCSLKSREMKEWLRKNAKDSDLQTCRSLAASPESSSWLGGFRMYWNSKIP